VEKRNTSREGKGGNVSRELWEGKGGKEGVEERKKPIDINVPKQDRRASSRRSQKKKGKDFQRTLQAFKRRERATRGEKKRIKTRG